MITYRIGLSQHSFKLLRPIKPQLEKDKKEDIKRMMNDLMAQFTEVIKAHPEQYFWYNKRWVLRSNLNRHSLNRPYICLTLEVYQLNHHLVAHFREEQSSDVGELIQIHSKYGHILLYLAHL